MSLLVATQITAVATAVLAIGAIITSVFAIRAFGKQSEQLNLQREELAGQQVASRRQAEMLDLQASELRASLAKLEREAQAERSAQARRVDVKRALRLDPRPDQVQLAVSGQSRSEVVIIDVTNDSDHPIYDLSVSWHKGTAPWGEPDHQPHLPAKGDAQFMQELPPDFPDSVDKSAYGAVVYFRDANGVRWRVRPGGGQPEEINMHFYGVTPQEIPGIVAEARQASLPLPPALDDS